MIRISDKPGCLPSLRIVTKASVAAVFPSKGRKLWQLWIMKSFAIKLWFDSTEISYTSSDFFSFL